MNSILQCLNHIKPITNFFLKGEYLKEINKNNPLGSGGRISTAYASFLNDVWGNDYSILAPRLLKQTVGSFAPQFNNNFQHDSQEFCQFLMDGLHEDLNRVKNKPYVEQMEAYGMEDRMAAEESWRNHLKRHDSIFVDYTQGMHRSHLTCPGCGRESVKFDVYSSISLPLVPPKRGSSIPLKDCLDQFAAGEQLDEHNAWYCSNCKKHVCALKLITLWNTPDILVLHLKRFTFEKCPDVDGRILRKKIEDTVNFPIDRLDMTEYVLGPIDPGAPPIYKVRLSPVFSVLDVELFLFTTDLNLTIFFLITTHLYSYLELVNTQEPPPTVVTTQPQSATPRMEIGTDTTTPMSALHPEMPLLPGGHTYSSTNGSKVRCVGLGWKRS
jgi:ubiquitin carboxyl-terminal hydrolase 8